MFQRIVAWAGGQLRNLGGLILPLATWKNVSTFARVLWWVAFVVLNGLILVGLWWANDHWKLAEKLPSLPRWLKPFWMPVIWLFVLAITWTSYWLWGLLVSDDLSSDFPDLDEAWAMALAALRKQNVVLDDVPLFLVLGKPRGDEKNVFDAAGIELPVPGEPGRGAPVRVFCGNLRVKRDTTPAIFVCCPDASVLSAQAAFLARQPVGGAASGEPEEEDWETASMADDGTMLPGKGGAVAQVLEALAQGEGSMHSPVQQVQLAQMERASRRLSLPNEERERQAARLRHVCKLIARDRYPTCPTNGILVLLPFAGTDTEADAMDTANACGGDLKTARTALGLHCPVLALICDMEAAPGFAQFVAEFDPPKRMKRMGQGFPLVPVIPTSVDGRDRSADSLLREKLRSQAVWIGRGFLRRWVYEKCKLEKSADSTAAEAMQTNKWLILLLTEMQNRQGHLGKILEHGFSGYADEQWLLYGGCYFAGTGDKREHRAFVHDLLTKLLETSAFVYWTQEVRDEDARLERWITWGWVLLGLTVVVATAGLLFMVIRK